MKKQTIGILGLNHNTAPIEIRERLYANEETVPILLRRIRERGVAESVIISTCNRTEIYFSGGNNDKTAREIRSILSETFTAPEEWFNDYTYCFSGEEAYRHLFIVASGLDSMVIGEPEILGQVKDAYRTAARAGSTSFYLNKTFHKTFSVAKRIRTETRIGYNPLSISSMAVELAKKIFGNLEEKKILVIGAGEMCETALKYFQKEGVREVYIANRTYQKARELAGEIIGTAMPFSDLSELLAVVDMVLTSTGSERPIIGPDLIQTVMKKRKNRPIFLIDIAVPRDIDPSVNNIGNTYLYDIDDLKELSQKHLADRVKESEKARTIIDEEVLRFSEWLGRVDVNPLISHIMAKAEEVRSRELKKTLGRLGELDEETLNNIDIMTRTIVNKLVYPYLALIKKKYDPTVFEVLKELFRFEENDEKEMGGGDKGQ